MNSPTLFDDLEPEPEPTPTPATPSRDEYNRAMLAAAESYRQARPELCRNRVFYGPQETSQKAAARALPRTGTQRHRIWELIKTTDGMTADEINAATNISPNTINPTIRGLVLDGWLEDSGQRRATRAGNEAIVWRHIP